MDLKNMFNIACGLYIVATSNQSNQTAACVINTVMQVTENPLRIVIALNHSTETSKRIQSSGQFTISILDQSTKFNTIQHFGFQSSRDIDKFNAPPLKSQQFHNMPALAEQANTILACSVVTITDLGSHCLILADVNDSLSLSSLPTLTYAYYQANIKPKPKPATTSKTTWRCEVCGYEIQTDALPDNFICPICNHGIEAFVKISPDHDSQTPNPAPPEKNSTKTTWRCDICGYETQADTLPDNFTCPICGYPASAFKKIS